MIKYLNDIREVSDYACGFEISTDDFEIFSGDENCPQRRLPEEEDFRASTDAVISLS